MFVVTAARARGGLLSVALALAAALAGCGVGAPSRPQDVSLTVTSDFGAQSVLELPGSSAGAHESALAFLQRSASVQTTAGAVQSVNGYPAGAAGRWLLYVNGVRAGRGAATQLNGGDHVWWDRHGIAASPRAVVGAFPEPFLHGSGGRRLPVVVECSDPAATACALLSHRLASLGIPAARGKPGIATSTQVLRVLVGEWPSVRRDLAAEQIERGPQLSGVFARLDASGRTLTLLDQRGTAARTLGPGSGLIAATQRGTDQPVWVVTGTDAAGVAAAAQAFEAGPLHDRFAIAISSRTAIGLPVASGRGTSP